MTPTLRGRCSECQTVFLASEAEQRVENVPEQEVEAPLTPLVPLAGHSPLASRPLPRDGRFDFVCLGCGKGLKRQETKSVQRVVLCLACGGICEKHSEILKKQALEEMRDRSLFAELKTIITYPWVNPSAFLAMALFVGLFHGMAMIGMGIVVPLAMVFSQGVVMAYAFTAMTRVCDGNLKNYMPDLTDLDDLIGPLWLSLSCVIAIFAPLFIVAYFHWHAIPVLLKGPSAEPPKATSSVRPAHVPREQVIIDNVRRHLEETPPTSEKEGERFSEHDFRPPKERIAEAASRANAGKAGFYLFLALLWGIFYAPAAMIAAGVTRSFWAPLNILLGVGTMLRMGKGYLAVLAIFIPLVLVQGFLGGVVQEVPGIGWLLKASVDAYFWLCIGCTLGFGLFKHAEELGLKN